MSLSNVLQLAFIWLTLAFVSIQQKDSYPTRSRLASRTSSTNTTFNNLSMKRPHSPIPNSNKKKSKHSTRTCAVAGCTTQVTSPSNAVPLCKTCNDRLATLAETEMKLHWFTCHIDTSFIRWSSHPEILPPTPLPLGPAQSLHLNYDDDTAMNAAALAIHKADAILIVAGAGMSCDSGLPDYRGATGFYRMGGKDISMESVNFHPDRDADFLLSMGFITTMISEFRQKKPHEGYHMLRRITNLKKTENNSASIPLPTSSSSSSSPISTSNHFVLTSNIDAYFLRSGFNETEVYESHGNCNLLQCCQGGTWDDACKTSGIWKWPDGYVLPTCNSDLKITKTDALLLPRCQSCNAYARPHISHSTDYPEDIVPTRKAAQEKALLVWLDSISHKSLAVIEIGCGTSIHSLRVETEIMVGKRTNPKGPKTTLIRIDPGNADVPNGDHVGVKMKAMEALLGIENKIGMLEMSQGFSDGDESEDGDTNSSSEKSHSWVGNLDDNKPLPPTLKRN